MRFSLILLNPFHLAKRFLEFSNLLVVLLRFLVFVALVILLLSANSDNGYVVVSFFGDVS